IDDYAPLHSEHQQGPSYALSDSDKTVLAEELGRLKRQSPVGLEVVGYYRSHTREGLYLDDADLDVIRTHFAELHSVFLLIKPCQKDASLGGFFFWEEGEIRRHCSYREFPFNRRELDPHDVIVEMDEVPIEGEIPKQRHTITKAINGASPQFYGTEVTANGNIKPQLRPAPPPASRASFGAPRWLWVPLAIALMVLLPVTWLRTARETAPITEEGPPELTLNAERVGGALRLSWNRRNPMVLNAERGVLWITDGDSEKTLNLDAEQLRSGNVLYWPVSGDVNFRLELFVVARSISESLRTYTDVSPTAENETAGEEQAAGPLQRTGIRTSASRTADRSDTATPQAVLPPPAESGNPRSSGTARVVPPKLGKPPLINPTTISPTQDVSSPALRQDLTARTPVLAPVTEVTIEPVKESGIRRTLAKVPGLGMLKRQRYRDGEQFEPAKPVHRTIPFVPSEIRNSITGEVPIDLKLDIDKSGKVTGTQLLNQKADRRLLAVAAESLTDWTFEPARLNGSPVSSQVIVHFKFSHPAEARR
ncbi:MAG: energy transducer TonB, partial [Bryobacteraceae bacterium]